MMANVFDYLTTETQRTPSVNTKENISAYSCASAVKIFFGQENYEA
jgi:hypothetical protein